MIIVFYLIILVQNIVQSNSWTHKCPLGTYFKSLKVGLKNKSTFKGQFFQSFHIFDYGMQSFHFWT
jgi:hypothetical protein